MSRYDESFRLNLSESMKKKMEAVAEAENINQSELVRSAIDEYLQNASTTPQEELARVNEKIDEAEREAKEHRESAEEYELQIEELRGREQELAKQLEKVSQLDSLEDLLERIVRRSVEDDEMNISQHQSLVKDTGANFDVDEQEILQRIYTEYPEVPESEFHHRELDQSWTREWPEEYDEILERVARLARWRDKTSTDHVIHIAEHYDVEDTDLLEDVSARYDDLQVSQRDADSDLKTASDIVLTSH